MALILASPMLMDLGASLGRQRLSVVNSEGAYSVRDSDIGRIVSGSRGSSMKTSPVALTDEKIAGIVRSRL